MNTKKIVFMAVFAALCYVATSIITFPISFGWGYIHLGDAVVMLAGMLLGPVFGALAAGTGSALADLSAGYAHYMLATFLVKAMLAFVIGLAYRDLKGKARNASFIQLIYHICMSVIVVSGGYFVADFILATFAAVDTEGVTALAFALYGLPWNAIQVLVGVTISLLLYYPLKKPFETVYLEPQIQ